MKDKKKETEKTTETETKPTTPTSPTSTPSVKTGDETPIAMWGTIMLLAMLTITTILRKRRTDK